MLFTTTTDLNELHDSSLKGLKEMIETSELPLIETLSLAEGIAMELYQIEIIKPDEYHPLSRYLKRGLSDPKNFSVGDFPQYADQKSVVPRTVSEQEIATIKRVVPAEIKRDLTRCFRSEDIPFINQLKGRTMTLEKLGLIDETESKLMYAAFQDKISNFTR